MSLGWSKAKVVETMEATVFLKFRQKTTQLTTQMCTYNPCFQYPSTQPKKSIAQTFSIWPWFYYIIRQLYSPACFKIGRTFISRNHKALPL